LSRPENADGSESVSPNALIGQCRFPQSDLFATFQMTR
jgi:hypothetical protein